MTIQQYHDRYGSTPPAVVYQYGIDQYFKLLEQLDELEPLVTEIAKLTEELEGDLIHESFVAFTIQRDRLKTEVAMRRNKIKNAMNTLRRDNKEIDLIANAPTVGGRAIIQDGSDRQEVAA